MPSTLKRIVTNSVVAAIYVALTLLTSSFSYKEIQFRLAEILMLLIFFRKDYLIGLSVGCFLANLFGPLGYIDALIGTLATILSGLAIAYSKRLFVATLYPVIINGLIIGAELYFFQELPIPYPLAALFVMIGQFVVISIFGFIVFDKLRRNPHFMKLIDANQNLFISNGDANHV